MLDTNKVIKHKQTNEFAAHEHLPAAAAQSIPGFRQRKLTQKARTTDKESAIKINTRKHTDNDHNQKIF
jgi:hypothetical protein